MGRDVQCETFAHTNKHAQEGRPHGLPGDQAPLAHAWLVPCRAASLRLRARTSRSVAESIGSRAIGVVAASVE